MQLKTGTIEGNPVGCLLLKRNNTSTRDNILVTLSCNNLEALIVVRVVESSRRDSILQTN